MLCSLLHPGDMINCTHPGNILYSAFWKPHECSILETFWMLHPKLGRTSCIRSPVWMKKMRSTETHWPRQSKLFKSLAEEGNYCEIHPSHSADSYLSYPSLSQHISRHLLNVYVRCTRTFLRKNSPFTKKNVKSAQKNKILCTSTRKNFTLSKPL